MNTGLSSVTLLKAPRILIKHMLPVPDGSSLETNMGIQVEKDKLTREPEASISHGILTLKSYDFNH